MMIFQLKSIRVIIDINNRILQHQSRISRSYKKLGRLPRTRRDRKPSRSSLKLRRLYQINRRIAEEVGG